VGFIEFVWGRGGGGARVVNIFYPSECIIVYSLIM